MPFRSRRHRSARFHRLRRLGGEQLEARQLLAGVPFGASPTDTAEYMLGDVSVQVVFLESGATSQNTESWNATTINRVKTAIQSGLDWWEDTLHEYFPAAPLEFHLDFTHADAPFVVPFEPIERTSDQHLDFVNLFLSAQGYSTGLIVDRTYAYNHAQRIANDTDWSFTIFVVNSENDNATDHFGIGGQWATGGSFQGAFAYPGGRYVVAMSDRPAHIFAHEAAHMFWALDEYSAGDHYTVRRGYYNQQNTNGANGRPAGSPQPQPSVMSGGAPQLQSYQAHSLPADTQAHVGWRDSDGDGILDVLDVPHSLTGRGFIDPQTGHYRFVGQSQVRTLPNMNSAGNKNDITINRIYLAEYSFDGQTWQTAGTYDTHTASLDLTIPLTGQSQISIRTRDTRTGVTSDVFTAPTDRYRSTALPGINGFVYKDSNDNGQWDSGETTLGNRPVQLVDQHGQPLAGPAVLDPANYANESSIDHAVPQATLSVVGDLPSSTVLAFDATFGATTSRVFAGVTEFGSEQLLPLWNSSKRLKIEFAAPLRQFSLDAIGTLDAGSYARVEIYDANHTLLGRYTTSQVALGQAHTMTLSSASNIAYAVAYGHAGTHVAFDHLVIGAPVTTTTDAFGAFALPYLAAGSYFVQAVAPEDWEATAPASAIQQVTLTTGQPLVDVNFGQRIAHFSWQNGQNRFDVNADQVVTPLDALLVIIDLNARGPRELLTPPAGEGPPTLIDVNADGHVTPLDALEVIIYLNSRGSSQGEAFTAGGAGAQSPPAAESPGPLPAATTWPPTADTASGERMSERQADVAADDAPAQDDHLYCPLDEATIAWLAADVASEYARRRPALAEPDDGEDEPGGASEGLDGWPANIAF